MRLRTGLFVVARAALAGWIVVAVTLAAAAAPAQPRIAVYANSSEVMVFWDPADSFSNEIIAMNTMYETLLRYDPANDTFKPVLATSWQRSADGLTWTFTLRDGVKFHTGKPLTAQAAQKALQRTIDRGKGASFIWSPVKAIRAPDAHTLIFELQYPAPLDLIAASSYGAFIYDAEPAEQHGDAWFTQGHDSGTGPYTVERAQAGGDVVLTRFDAYWGGWPEGAFDRVVFQHVAEPFTRRQMLESGQADFTNMLPFEQLQQLERNPAVRVTRAPAFQNLLGMLNTQKKPLSDVRVRQAISYLVPYEAIVRTVLRNYGVQARGTVPKGLWGHSDQLPQYTLDVERARRLLAEAGYPNGNFKLMLTYTAGNEDQRRTAELLKAALSQVNIDLEIRPLVWEQQWDLAKAPDPNRRQDILLFYWWASYADPYDFLFNLFHSEDEIVFNLSYYRNPQYDRLIDEGHRVSGLDRDKAAELYVQAQQLLVKDAAAIFFYDQQYARAISASLQGYVDNPAYPHVVWWHEVRRAAGR